MYLEAQLFLSAGAGTDAWGAISTKAKEKNFGTSKQDIDDYAAAGGAAAGAAACVAAEQPELSPLCAELGGVIGSAVADFVQSVGSLLFGGGDSSPSFRDQVDGRADKLIAAIVKAVRVKEGLGDESQGGTYKNYPEWKSIAAAWAANTNAIYEGTLDGITYQGVPVAKWETYGVVRKPFNDDATDPYPGHLLQAYNDWIIGHVAVSVQNTRSWPPNGPASVALSTSVAATLNQAMIEGAQQTLAEQLGSVKPATSVTSTVLKVGAFAGAGALVWYFRQPIFHFVSRILKV